MSIPAVTIDATPLYNTPEIPFEHLPLQKDEQRLIRAIETIAFPGTRCQIVSQISEYVVQIKTAEYPCLDVLYADRRFLKHVELETPEREKGLPSSETILESLQNLVGTRYFWGGNWEEGIPRMLEVYPHLRQASPEDQEDVICKGVDCSGLLYRVTQGMTPRNTSQLIEYGKELPLQNLSSEEIQALLKPLDLLVWRGHIIIALNSSTVIESRGGDGVVISVFQKRYLEIIELVKKQNKILYFRRWHPDFLPKS